MGPRPSALHCAPPLRPWPPRPEAQGWPLPAGRLRRALAPGGVGVRPGGLPILRGARGAGGGEFVGGTTSRRERRGGTAPAGPTQRRTSTDAIMGQASAMETGPTAIRRTLIKARGAHYTPPELAAFLADAILQELGQTSASIRVLDPACGDGSLLLAIATAAAPRLRSRLHLVGLDTHPQAIEGSRSALGQLDVASVELRVADFLLESGPGQPGQGLLALGLSDGSTGSVLSGFDAVIANPPYVRTQVLGAERARRLAQRFGLSGRVDLYHAFLRAMALALRDHGVLGLLTSNRFLVTQAGAAMRQSLQQDFDLLQVIDLGDTKLFSAAVLPAIAIARRGKARDRSSAAFVRVYEVRGADRRLGARVCSSVLHALERGEEGLVQVGDVCFNIERGALRVSADPSQPWALSSERTHGWSQTVAARTVCRFGDVAKIRVGIKTTADAVFIRSDWGTFPPNTRPEEELLRPLLTHRVAGRWTAKSGGGTEQVLYPHTISAGRRVPVNLDGYPRARAYLESHRERLSSRKYVIEAGRRWYEIWVPQHPSDWARPKIVFPDISETPRFFLDYQGAVVNGDCYWITLLAGKDQSWLHLMLAVANSSFIERYYDTMFNNKLYAGRRRFLTQYVEKFPLPAPDSPCAKEVISLARQRLAPGCIEESKARELEDSLDRLVWQLFGFVEEAGRQRDLQLLV